MAAVDYTPSLLIRMADIIVVHARKGARTLSMLKLKLDGNSTPDQLASYFPDRPDKYTVCFQPEVVRPYPEAGAGFQPPLQAGSHVVLLYDTWTLASMNRLLKQIPSTLSKSCQLDVPQAIVLSSVLMSLFICGGIVAVASKLEEVGLTGCEKIAAAMAGSSTTGHPTITSETVSEASKSVEHSGTEHSHTAASSRGDQGFSIVPALTAVGLFSLAMIM
ncbi:hypothetical protein KFL_001100060 [Klebsormidium nitens]|uniref:Uncharacterized protein n=1 Tax=Klebsormidium nitens TaxID=105231 RepID=A0A1Y1HX92_KLENI|nr:hypothetical protein KFL_001100060 [Klebsormidium nitens]|eukprot:GAQ82392.1 hypothetical protein KFL_001100060 [Klebsormidium nitens]